ncbi:MAG: IS21 family transposase [Woeseia sp.]
MRRIRDVLRLRATGHSRRQVAQSCGIARSTVAEYVKRAEAAGLSWPSLGELDDAELESKLFPPAPVIPAEHRAVPDWAGVHRELKRKGVTLTLLWDEYKAANPEGYQYSWFCEHYRHWLGKVDVVMRQDHRAGEKLFVDYAGQTVPLIDRATGEVQDTQIFVAVLGASNYTYAEATLTQSLPDWIGSHVRAFRYFGSVPAIIVPDNVKSGVHLAHRYEPELNATYAEMGRHYGVAVIPTRSAKPRDKAKAEVAVQIVERWILAPLRNRTFFSLAELNAAIAELLEVLNSRPFKKLPGTRRSLFEMLDRPAMQPLPSAPYEYAEWKKVRVNIDYHVAIDKHYYSVPYQLVKQQLEARITANTVELFNKGKRIASHRRSTRPGAHTTVNAHMPKAHREYAEWTPQRLVRWARETGPATAKLVATILASRPHPQHGFRACLGIMRLGKRYTAKRLEAASRRALAIGACSYKSIESILKNGLDKKPLPATTIESPAIEHDNLRGPDYYH